MENYCENLHRRESAKDDGGSGMSDLTQLIEKAIEAVELLGKIRCSARRHDLDREWLTAADKVIGYWDETRTKDRLRAENEALKARWKQFEEFDCSELKAVYALVDLLKVEVVALHQELQVAEELVWQAKQVKPDCRVCLRMGRYDCPHSPTESPEYPCINGSLFVHEKHFEPLWRTE
jgi:hypothetical protein